MRHGGVLHANVIASNRNRLPKNCKCHAIRCAHPRPRRHPGCVPVRLGDRLPFLADGPSPKGPTADRLIAGRPALVRIRHHPHALGHRQVVAIDFPKATEIIVLDHLRPNPGHGYHNFLAHQTAITVRLRCPGWAMLAGSTCKLSGGTCRELLARSRPALGEQFSLEDARDTDRRPFRFQGKPNRESWAR